MLKKAMPLNRQGSANRRAVKLSAGVQRRISVGVATAGSRSSLWIASTRKAE